LDVISEYGRHTDNALFSSINGYLKHAEHGFVLRLIEAMPVESTGRNTKYIDLQPVQARLRQKFNLKPQAVELGGGPARYRTTQVGTANIGFIIAMSQHFCATCNRVCLSVDGTLYLCLGQEARFEFRPLLCGGANDTDLDNAIRQAIEHKPQKHKFIEQPEIIVRFMSQTGG
jgi:cyclic pyranopterin phosphate synthase